MKRGLGILLCAVMFSFGCAKKEVVTVQPEPMTTQERAAFLALARRNQNIQTVRAAGRLFAWDRGELVTDLAVALVLPDHVRIEALDSLADVTAMAGSDGSRVWVWLPAEGKLYRGRATKRNLKRIVHVEWDVQDLTHLLAGVVKIDSDDSLRQDQHDSSLFMVRGEPLTVRMDMGRGLPVMVTRYERAGDYAKPRYEVRFEEYRDVGGVPFPHRIVTHVPGRGTRVVFEYDEVELNRKVSGDIFQPPDV